MIAYVDTSVLLRKLFREPAPLAKWASIEQAYASQLLLVEVSRVIDRCRLTGRLDDESVAQLHEETARLVQSIDMVHLNDDLLERATLPMPTVIGTLDALHLVTALEIKRTLAPKVVFLTHDEQLARAARASGLAVQGL
jgi:predicted nucleic acid-binding protein